MILIYIIFIILIIIIYCIYLCCSSNYKSNIKILKYFGSASCPHSRVNSRAYNLMKEFESYYTDVKMEYKWSGEDIDEFKRGNIKSVPTIENKNYTKIELKLDDSVDTTNKTEDELKILLMQNLYSQL